MVKGIRNRLSAGGRCPVITAEGMKAWAISIEKAKVISKGKKVQSSTNHLWILSQSALVKASGSITGIVSLPSPALLPGQALGGPGLVKIITTLQRVSRAFSGESG
jgi:hypothetical protein